MSAIVSLLRVMTLRDADAIMLEAGRIPSLRRRGNVEALAMPALEPAQIDEFAQPLLGARSLDEGPLMVAFTDEDGVIYPVTIERGATGLKVVARRGGKAKAVPAVPAVPAAPARLELVPRPRPVEASDDSPAPLAAARDASAVRERLTLALSRPIATAVARRASDVLLSTGQRPRLRIDGRLEALDDLAIDDVELTAIVRELAGRDVGASIDLGLEVEGTRVRVNAFDHMAGVAIAARLINDHVPSLAELGLPPELASIVELRDGLVLVCGPTGSGKSTTLAALIDLLDQRRAAHIITLEDPIEYRFQQHRSLIHQRELGTHIPSFAAGLRAALREAPDVILLGELRDRDTIAAALTAAETGHLVLATLHAPNAIGAIDRVIDAFPEGQQRQIRTQLAGALRTVVTQFLLPKKAGGRVPALEVVPVIAAVANLIRKGDLHMLPTAIQAGRDAGMIPLERSLAKLLDAGVVSREAVKRIAADQDLLAALAGKLR